LKVGSQRKLEANRQAEPESGIDGASWRSTHRWAGRLIEGASWRSARRRSLEQQAAQVAGRFEGRAGRLAEGASWKLAGRHGRNVDWRRKPKEGRKAKPKDAATDESEVRFEGRAGGSVEGASWRSAGKRSRTMS